MVDVVEIVPIISSVFSIILVAFAILFSRRGKTQKQLPNIKGFH